MMKLFSVIDVTDGTTVPARGFLQPHTELLACIRPFLGSALNVRYQSAAPLLAVQLSRKR